jgi:hypothetical protein
MGRLYGTPATPVAQFNTALPLLYWRFDHAPELREACSLTLAEFNHHVVAPKC